MRLAMMASAAALMLVAVTAAPAQAAKPGSPTVAVAVVQAPVSALLAASQDPQPATPKQDVKVTTVTNWWVSPMAIAAGIVVIALIVVAIVASRRGSSSTTVIR